MNHQLSWKKKFARWQGAQAPRGRGAAEERLRAHGGGARGEDETARGAGAVRASGTPRAGRRGGKTSLRAGGASGAAPEIEDREGRASEGTQEIEDREGSIS